MRLTVRLRQIRVRASVPARPAAAALVAPPAREAVPHRVQPARPPTARRRQQPAQAATAHRRLHPAAAMAHRPPASARRASIATPQDRAAVRRVNPGIRRAVSRGRARIPVRRRREPARWAADPAAHRADQDGAGRPTESDDSAITGHVQRNVSCRSFLCFFCGRH